MSIEIIIDSRESELIRILQDSITVKTLDIGDIQIRHNDKDVFLLERKTVADLAASIKDGRYHEQKVRLMASMKEASAQMIGYLIEGNILSTAGIAGIAENTLLSAIVNTFVRDGIVVFRTFSVGETAKFLLKLAEKIALFGLDKNEKPQEPSETSYLNTISRVKKANMTARLCYMSQLCQIPGVSGNIAQKISIEYPTMEKLIVGYRTIESEKGKEGMLVISTAPKSLLNPKTRGRRIGPKVSARVYRYLFGIEEN